MDKFITLQQALLLIIIMECFWQILSIMERLIIRFTNNVLARIVLFDRLKNK